MPSPMQVGWAAVDASLSETGIQALLQSRPQDPLMDARHSGRGTTGEIWWGLKVQAWKECTSHAPIFNQAERSHTVSLRARQQVAFLHEHAALSLPHVAVQRERSGEGTGNVEKQPLCVGIVGIALVNYGVN